MSSKAAKSGRQPKVPSQCRAELLAAVEKLDRYLIERAVAPEQDAGVDDALRRVVVNERVATQWRSVANTVAMSNATERILRATERMKRAALKLRRAR